MIAAVQRVKSARLSCDGHIVSEIGEGLVVYLGIFGDDEARDSEYMLRKIPSLRIMSDTEGKMNLSVLDTGGEILLVSQFTLCGETRHGNRPSFSAAMRPEQAKPRYEDLLQALSAKGLSVRGGVFGGDMTIEQTNIGPVTIILNSRD